MIHLRYGITNTLYASGSRWRGGGASVARRTYVSSTPMPGRQRNVSAPSHRPRAILLTSISSVPLYFLFLIHCAQHPPGSHSTGCHCERNVSSDLMQLHRMALPAHDCSMQYPSPIKYYVLQSQAFPAHFQSRPGGKKRTQLSRISHLTVIRKGLLSGEVFPWWRQG